MSHSPPGSCASHGTRRWITPLEAADPGRRGADQRRRPGADVARVHGCPQRGAGGPARIAAAGAGPAAHRRALADRDRRAAGKDRGFDPGAAPPGAGCAQGLAAGARSGSRRRPLGVSTPKVAERRASRPTRKLTLTPELRLPPQSVMNRLPPGHPDSGVEVGEVEHRSVLEQALEPDVLTWASCSSRPQALGLQLELQVAVSRPPPACRNAAQVAVRSVASPTRSRLQASSSSWSSSSPSALASSSRRAPTELVESDRDLYFIVTSTRFGPV